MREALWLTRSVPPFLIDTALQVKAVLSILPHSSLLYQMPM